MVATVFICKSSYVIKYCFPSGLSDKKLKSLSCLISWEVVLVHCVSSSTLDPRLSHSPIQVVRLFLLVVTEKPRVSVRVIASCPVVKIDLRHRHWFLEDSTSHIHSFQLYQVPLTSRVTF